LIVLYEISKKEREIISHNIVIVACYLWNYKCKALQY